MTDLKSRAADNSVFLLRESLKELRYHADRMATDSTSIDRVTKEADLLSQSCKKLALYIEEPKVNEPAAITEGPDIIIEKQLRVLQTLFDPEMTCKTCGGVRPLKDNRYWLDTFKD